MKGKNIGGSKRGHRTPEGTSGCRLTLMPLKTTLSRVIIRPANKGSGIVVIDTHKYVTTINPEMSNNTTYQRVASDNTTTMQNKVNNTATNL